jgi:hypothetical protein
LVAEFQTEAKQPAPICGEISISTAKLRKISHVLIERIFWIELRRGGV